MPTSLLSLALFVVLLTPGLTYVLQRELKAPTRQASTFRETTSVVIASLVFDVAVSFVFWVLRFGLSKHTPDVGKLVRDGAPYLKAHYRYVATWAGGVIVAACGLGGLVGRWDPPGWLKRFTASDIAFHSAWWQVA